MKPVLKQIVFVVFFVINLTFAGKIITHNIPSEFTNPPREFTVMPFWFWNDTLKEEEIVRQIADFENHGVYGFVIHPRIGLPENMEWLSPEMIHAMNVAVQEASKRKMYVVLYDEGMYPSGSSSGQVVARNSCHAARGLAKIDIMPGDKLQLSAGTKLVTTIARPGGKRVAIIEKPSGGVIRGLHYIGKKDNRIEEESPPAGDILNPDAVTSFIELVYDRFAKEFGTYFGTTILGIFTDEPSPLGRVSEKGLFPGNAALLEQINRILGYDIKPYLGDLWYSDLPGSDIHRVDYNRAINICLEENYYRRLGDWCKDHQISLMGHPAESMDIGAQRYFQVPGQDLVWRYVEPGAKALEGPHSTMAKGASSAMVHQGLRRNSNELYGAYGHNLTYDEMQWLANWCFVRGQNFLFPHAFYYSIRGPRFDERPPDVGPNSSWWDTYKPFADACRRLSWLNTDSKQVCSLAILCEATWLPDTYAKICYQNQCDFNYLEIRYLQEGAKVDAGGIHISGMHYKALMIDGLSFLPDNVMPSLNMLAANGRLLIGKNTPYSAMFEGARIIQTPEETKNAIIKVFQPDISIDPMTADVRYRHVVKNGDHYYILFNEGAGVVTAKLQFSVTGKSQWLNPFTAEVVVGNEDEKVQFKPHELKILRISQ
ncbi:MAG: hypothetical protein A2268_06900 [Candidatus Raymondbacteria bacterium RifOxyA12_full_50_37]|uniref:Uncharacterized protein n=1 Tax=Candidatus Raymondbacteria bacterium RIFOXYD12_FULL_49_13 TaxID=1817890 RepID=A0A1F7FEQ5_UNCRA|nr:MAG: hypothetical protein A2268_06900 [Candidatus Raymondbacteria bacterium RifOxyA12_full_50_37]OGJ91115.1 MAG: hypothetical protein A2248_01055 [Candidatus Raymondbacteria bacterium RIFOXYA2_FULL_49_16]OGJ97512.1 MAG: hypothetical protein A2453_01815 [Candidatus Raymondbacteria bacterium RIFOXYC2_FULL_50_21]OGJ99611.1 MAG: hypothetical protein A2487_07835 [Candidatus Raymondbacteria bacterium RifOxyC12_full_50_8]OGK00183.1 MAG: hypothetical protein A2350_16490 [Candidatus Raymondbacteria b